MPLPTFAKADEVPAAFKDFYEEKDGAWQPTKLATADDVGTVRGALDKERDARQAAERGARAQADEIARLKREAAARESGADQAKLDELLKKFDAEKAAALKPLEERATQQAAELRALKLDSKVKDAMLKAGVLPARVDKLFKLAADRFDLTDEGRVVVLGADGKPSTTALDAFVAGELKTDNDWAYGAPPASGSGATAAAGARAGERPGGGPLTWAEIEKLTPEAQLAYARTHKLT